VQSESVERAHGRVGVGHADVHVQRRLRRALDQAAHVVLDAGVAGEIGQQGVARLGGRVQRCGQRRRAGGQQGRAAGGERGQGLFDVATDGRAQLHLGRERLVAGGSLRQVERREHPHCVRHERARVRVHEEVLLLDPEGEGWLLAERVVHRQG
jgi:hypothetical protein